VRDAEFGARVGSARGPARPTPAGPVGPRRLRSADRVHWADHADRGSWGIGTVYPSPAGMSGWHVDLVWLDRAWPDVPTCGSRSAAAPRSPLAAADGSHRGPRFASSEMRRPHGPIMPGLARPRLRPRLRPQCRPQCRPRPGGGGWARSDPCPRRRRQGRRRQRPPSGQPNGGRMPCIRGRSGQVVLTVLTGGAGQEAGPQAEIAVPAERRSSHARFTRSAIPTSAVLP